MAAYEHNANPGPISLDAIHNQLTAFRKSDEAREDLVRAVIGDLLRTREALQLAQDDLISEKESRLAYQKQLRELRVQVNSFEKRTDNHTFALVLLDGDGDVFADRFLSRGYEGGSEAAHAFNREIQHALRSEIPELENISIYVQIYANVSGLARTLVRNGVIGSPADLYGFISGFNFSQTFFNFIDVGYGKERADHKIKEMFRMFINNSHCKYVVLGGLQDNGYANILEPIKQNDELRSKLALVETTPAARAYSSYSFHRLYFPNVFRTEKLLSDGYAPISNGSLPTNQHHAGLHNHMTNVISPPPGLEGLSGYYNNSTHSDRASDVSSSQLGGINGGSNHDGAPNEPTMVSSPEARFAQADISGQSALSNVTNTNTNAAAPLTQRNTSSTIITPAKPAAPSTYASVGANSASGAKEISIAARTTPSNSNPVPKRFLLLNADGERIDEPLPTGDPATIRRVEDRVARNGPLCNAYHLNGRCEKDQIGACTYQHGERLGPKERLAWRQKARGTRCLQKQYCMKIDCPLGHICQYGKNCTRGTSCYFYALHGMDTNPRVKIFEDGTQEYIGQPLIALKA